MHRVGFALVVLVIMVVPLSAQAQYKPATWLDNYPSQRIEALRRQISTGDNSTDDFWAEIAQEGAPLFEPTEPDDTHQLVTFLWRGTPETQNVLVVWSPFAGVQPQDFLMTQLGDSDVWYLTTRELRGARFLYGLSPNDLLDSRALGVWAERSPQADPLNPRQLAGRSVAELPGAPPQPWSIKYPETPAGTVREHHVTSDLLGTERTVSVYTPPGYQEAGAPHHLLVVFDKAIYENVVPVSIILDNLIAASRIPPTVAVLISNPAEIRNSDLLFGDTFVDFADFIATELVPWVRTRYNVSRDPSETVIGGVSAGGVAAAHTGLRHSDIFGNVLSQSGAFAYSPALLNELTERKPASDADDRHIQEEIQDRAATEGNGLATQFIQSPLVPLRFYMDVGVFEAGFMGGGLGALEANRHLRDVLLAKGYEVHYQQFVGGHDYLSWRGTFADGLIALIGRNER